jgi:hypothetical protein
MMISRFTKFISLSLLFASASSLSDVSANTPRSAYLAGHHKEAVSFYEEELSKADDHEKGAIRLKLALAYYHDQDDVMAFQTYLDALETSPLAKEEPTMCPEEKQMLADALHFYLDGVGQSPQDIAVKLRQKYAAFLALHPDYYALNFFLCAAYANIGMFDDFFEGFYGSYLAYPNSYMALKTKGMLHIKLFQRLSDPAAREVQQEKALHCFMRAQLLEPSDSSLYRMIITFNQGDKKSQAVHTSLKKIVEDNIVIPRSDIYFFVQEAIGAEANSLAEQFIQKARGWYRYSRSLEAAEELLNRQSIE